MDRPRIALLNASYNGASTRRNFRRELAADLAEFDVVSGSFPDTYDFDGVVITGSGASVYWDEQWISDLVSWVRVGIDRGLPHFGICYGHQVLATALGGTVEDMGEYELGYRTVNRVGESRLLDGLDESFTVFISHSDRVTTLPDGARIIAENEYGVHGFERENVFSLQSHPEFDLDTARRTAENKDLPSEQLSRVLAEITDENYALACASKQVFDNFLTVVRERAVAPAD